MSICIQGDFESISDKSFLVNFVTKGIIAGSIISGCQQSGDQCYGHGLSHGGQEDGHREEDGGPCHNDGQCKSGWNRFICECSLTNFTGPTCTRGNRTIIFQLFDIFF